MVNKTLVCLLEEDNWQLSRRRVFALIVRVVHTALAMGLIGLTPACTLYEGGVARFHGEENPHGVPLSVPEGVRILSDFKSRYTTIGTLRAKEPNISSIHKGIDIAGNPGDAVLSPTFGYVTVAIRGGSKGGLVEIKNPVPYNLADLMENFTSPYYERLRVQLLHLGRILKKEGDEVNVGDVIGTIGTEGTYKPHVHMSVWSGGTLVNPHKLWLNGVGIVTCYDPAKQPYPKDRFYLVAPTKC